ncbi:Na(+)/H(+) antiporter subunit B [Aliibacillus thermotolerans]|uniref:Na(+)/H(+) antiporter subunit B n=1 Tax=Aliibacillus thermotolerans TaxID=1834418 RepID=A0ABW0U8J6_9BACI|nr:Na(+)/H(+) antiporter subunit B [Aliibacillus thermotolerans]
MKLNDIVIQTTTKFVLFIILAFSIFIFFNGHHHPGGGFIGGLMTSAAITLLLLAFDFETVKRILPIDFKILTASGMLIATLTGMGGLVFGGPFLSHTFGYVHLPFFGEVELATALLFDLGVYFVVVGSALTIIEMIGGDQ